MSGMEEEEDGEPNVQVSCISEFAEYSYNASHSIWAVVSLKAPHQKEEGDEEGSSKQRAGMDLVGVIDKSGSMAGEKMELVKSTLQFVLTQCTLMKLYRYHFKAELSMARISNTQMYLDFGPSELINLISKMKSKNEEARDPVEDCALNVFNPGL